MVVKTIHYSVCSGYSRWKLVSIWPIKEGIYSYWKKNQQIHQEHFDRKSNVYLREIVNRQPVFKIHLDHDETKEIYVRVKNTYSSEFSFELYRSNDFFSHYVMDENRLQDVKR